jgi:hypothetical protein
MYDLSCQFVVPKGHLGIDEGPKHLITDKVGMLEPTDRGTSTKIYRRMGRYHEMVNCNELQSFPKGPMTSFIHSIVYYRVGHPATNYQLAPRYDRNPAWGFHVSSHADLALRYHVVLQSTVTSCTGTVVRWPGM